MDAWKTMYFPFGAILAYFQVLLLMAEILHQLRSVVHPIIYEGFYTSQVIVWISEPSTV